MGPRESPREPVRAGARASPREPWPRGPRESAPPAPRESRPRDVVPSRRASGRPVGGARPTPFRPRGPSLGRLRPGGASPSVRALASGRAPPPCRASPTVRAPPPLRRASPRRVSPPGRALRSPPRVSRPVRELPPDGRSPCPLPPDLPCALARRGFPERMSVARLLSRHGREAPRPTRENRGRRQKAHRLRSALRQRRSTNQRMLR